MKRDLIPGRWNDAGRAVLDRRAATRRPRDRQVDENAHAVGDGWRYEIGGVSYFREAEAEIVREFIASRADRLSVPYVRQARELRADAYLPGLIPGWLLGAATGASLAILLVRLGAMLGAR